MSITTAFGFAERLEHLRRRKEEQTKEKLDRIGPIDEDDYGFVCPPAEFTWTPPICDADGFWHGADAWSINFADLMERHPLYVDPRDALAGRWMFFMSRLRPRKWPQSAETPESLYKNQFQPLRGVLGNTPIVSAAEHEKRFETAMEWDYSHLHEEQERYSIIDGIGGDQHFCTDFQIGLRLGWGGILTKVRDSRLALADDPKARELLDAEERVVLAIQTLIRRTAAYARELAQAEECPELQKNLREMGEINERLVDEPPTTFREACQWIAWEGIVGRTYNREGAGGQLDEILRPYYEADVAAGILDDEEAIFILACLLLNDPKYYQLGGPDETGRDQTSHVSFLILEAAHRLQSSCNLTIRVHDGLDDDLLTTGVRHLLQDRKSWPRFSGDKALVEGFVRNGYSKELARQRIAVGCHWMAIPGREYTLNDLVKINTAKVFQVAWRETLDAESAPTLDSLWDRFVDHLRRAVLCTAKGIDFHLDHQWKNEPELVLNLLCHGPIEKGRDISDGGVEFYNMCVDAAALATVADSFAAIEQRVVDEERMSWRELDAILTRDFADTPRERLMLQKSDRYGQGDSRGDKWATRITEAFTRLVKEQPTPGGRNMIPGWFSWADTIRLGNAVGATPNGRLAGTPISHGANPNPGFRTDGAATAMATAIAGVQPGYGNTAPMQLELDPGLAHLDGAVEHVASLIRTHFRLGGTLMNISIVDAKKILEAHEDPTRYPDLIVRVTGFSAYFANLSPDFRQLVVDRVVAERMG